MYKNRTSDTVPITGAERPVQVLAGTETAFDYI